MIARRLLSVRRADISHSKCPDGSKIQSLSRSSQSCSKVYGRQVLDFSPIVFIMFRKTSGVVYGLCKLKIIKAVLMTIVETLILLTIITITVSIKCLCDNQTNYLFTSNRTFVLGGNSHVYKLHILLRCVATSFFNIIAKTR